MIKHIVFWKLRCVPEKEQNAQKMKELLEGLVGVVPGLISASVGTNITPGDYDIALISELKDEEALAVYQNHPAHVKVKEFVHSAVCARACVDFTTA